MQPLGEVLLFNDPEQCELDRGSIFFIGPATAIIRYAGFTILTNSAIEIEQLPQLDVCVLSHYHGGHFNGIAQEKLDKTLPIITTHHAAKRLKEKVFHSALSLDTWQAFVFKKGCISLRITSMPGKHGPPPHSKIPSTCDGQHA